MVIRDDEANPKNDKQIKATTYKMVVECAILHRRALELVTKKFKSF